MSVPPDRPVPDSLECGAERAAGPDDVPPLPAYWEWLKIPVTFWLVFHVAAMVIYPASIGAPPRELLSRLTARYFQRYMEALFLVGGHRFFAPEPGPSTLIQYRLEHPDGSVTEQIFPHRDIRPRLLYHRYFMLSERPMDVADLQTWYRMYARHLAYWYNAERVTLWRVVHRLPDPEDVIAGKPLNAPEFYTYEPMGSWTRQELEEGPLIPAEPQETPETVPPADGGVAP